MSKGSPSSPGSPSSVAQSAVIIVSPLRSRRQTLPPLLTWLSINEAAEAPTSPPSFAGEDAQNKLIIQVRRTAGGKQISMFARNGFSLRPERNLNDKSPAQRKRENTSKRFRLS